MSEKRSEKMARLQQENDWTDEDLGMLAIAFIFDPDTSGKAPEFMEFLDQAAEDDE